MALWPTTVQQQEMGVYMKVGKSGGRRRINKTMLWWLKVHLDNYIRQWNEMYVHSMRMIKQRKL